MEFELWPPTARPVVAGPELVDQVGGHAPLRPDGRAAVDDERLPGDPLGQRGRQEEQRVADVAGPRGGERVDAVDRVLAGRLILVAAADVAWRDRVDADAVPAELVR